MNVVAARHLVAYTVPLTVLVAVAWPGVGGGPSAGVVAVVVGFAAGWQGALLRTHVGLRRRARLDALTGLPDRAQLFERVQRALKSGRPIGLIFLDIDCFKDVNDRHGHAVGDRILEAVGRRLRLAAGPDRLVARYGGDEFAILAGADDLGALVHRVERSVCRPVEAADRCGAVSVSASVGVAVASRGSAGELFAAADAAMYEAKYRRARHPDSHPEFRDGATSVLTA